MNCWIASFPRSGNTFFRNILYFVYGIESGTFHKDAAFPLESNYDSYKFVKTHVLPQDLVPADKSIPAIYIVRDGRDALVSMAHHRRDLIVPGSDFYTNLKEAIIAAEGSFFGGWSKNVEAWMERAQLVIRYEDLLSDPQAVFEGVKGVVTLPPASWDKLPPFEEMKSGKTRYGNSARKAEANFDPIEFAGKFFRRGKAGGWKEDMPPDLHDLFWEKHGKTMDRLGYAR